MRRFTLLIGAAAGAVLGASTAAVAGIPPHEIWIQGWPIQVADEFGAAVAVHRGRIVVGSPQACPDLVDFSGRAHLFGNDGWGWSQITELAMPELDEQRHFGSGVAVCDDCVLVGAWGAALEGQPCGAVYEFHDLTDGVMPVATIVAADSAAGDCFGHAVAMTRTERGVVAVVGAPGRDLVLAAPFDRPVPVVVDDVGAAYVLRHGDDAWIEEGCLVPAEAGRGAAIGSAVDICGDVLVTAGNAGPAIVYRYDGSAWIEEAQLDFDVPVPTTGRAVSIDGDRIAIGAPTEFGGAVHLFGYGPRGWEGIGAISPVTTVVEPAFGRAVAIDGSTVLIGGTDQAWVYDGIQGAWGLRYALRDSELDASYGVAVALSDGIAVVGAPYGYQFGAVFVYDIEPNPDIDGDGFVGPFDLAAVSATWGPCAGCMTDVDGDGSVGVSDILAVLAAWSVPVP